MVASCKEYHSKKVDGSFLKALSEALATLARAKELDLLGATREQISTVELSSKLSTQEIFNFLTEDVVLIVSKFSEMASSTILEFYDLQEKHDSLTILNSKELLDFITAEKNKHTSPILVLFHDGEPLLIVE